MYYFEYDKEGFLYKYKEACIEDFDLLIEKKEHFHNRKIVKSYYYLTGSTIYRVESNGVEKNVIEYESPIMLKHRFEAGESWISVVEKVNDFKIEHFEEEEEEDNIDRKYPMFYGHKKEKPTNNSVYPYRYYPKIKKQLFLENDKLYNFKIQVEKNNLMKWKSIIDFTN